MRRWGAIVAAALASGCVEVRDDAVGASGRAPACVTDAPCGAQRRCVDGRCEPVSCASDAGCGATGRCRAGVCVGCVGGTCSCEPCALGEVCDGLGSCVAVGPIDCDHPVERCGMLHGVACGDCADGLICHATAGVCRPPDSARCFVDAGAIGPFAALPLGGFVHGTELHLADGRRLFFGADLDEAGTSGACSVALDSSGVPVGDARLEPNLDVAGPGWITSPASFSADGREAVVAFDRPVEQDAELFHTHLAWPREPEAGFDPSERITALDLVIEARPSSSYAPTLLPDGRTLLFFGDASLDALDPGRGLFAARRAEPNPEATDFARAEPPRRLVRPQDLEDPERAMVRATGVTADLAHVLLLVSPHGGPSTLARAALTLDADGRASLGEDEPIELRAAFAFDLWSATMSPDGARLWVTLRNLERDQPPFELHAFTPCP